ncbi:MAG: hypothetical protein ACK55X_02225 [Synechococcaceae cyanobacterium]|jgi:hypothetical protein
MRPLSFLFAALLGIVLAMIAPALAGPRPQAPVAQPALQVAIEQPLMEQLAIEAPLEQTAAEADAAEAELSVEEITRSLLDALGVADAA